MESRQRDSVEKSQAPYDITTMDVFLDESKARAIWDTLDVDKSGTLDPEELHMGLRRLGVPLSRGEEAKLRNSIRGWEQFRDFYKEKSAATWKAFRRIDVNGDGKLTPDEVTVALQVGGT